MSVILQFISYTPLSKWQQMNNLKSVDGQYCKQEKKKKWWNNICRTLERLRDWKDQ